MKATHITYGEGETWVTWDDHLQKYHNEFPRYTVVHAIKFDTGHVWDALNGFRPPKGDPLCQPAH